METKENKKHKWWEYFFYATMFNLLVVWPIIGIIVLGGVK